MGKRFILSFSGGKDSILALDRLVRQGMEPQCLLTAYDEHNGRSWFHGIPEPALREIAGALGIPLVLAACGQGGDYNRAFEEVLSGLRERGAEACAFGDIDLPAHRAWDEERCAAVGLMPLLPLWGEDRAALVGEFVDRGYVAVVKNVRLAELSEEFLGRELTHALAEEIRASGADICGENGEYHTVVVDGPLFSRRVALESRGSVRTDTHAFLDLGE